MAYQRYNVKGIPFRTKGAVDVSDCNTAEEVIHKAGLDWEVAKCNVVARMPIQKWEDCSSSPVEEGSFTRGSEIFRNLPNAFATYRTDKNVPLGYVKSRYEPVQNRDAFKFFNDAIGKDKAIWQTAGFFGNGERVFVSAKLPDGINVKGDAVDNYLVFTTSHDGSDGVKILFTPIRVVCENTLNAAIKTTSNYVMFKHTKNVHNNIDTAKEILGICAKQTKLLSEMFNFFAETKVTEQQAQEIFATSILDETEKVNLKEGGYTISDVINRSWNAVNYANISTRKVNALQEMDIYYHTGIGQENLIGTAWGAYNAVTGYYANVAQLEGEKKMDSVLYGSVAEKIKITADYIVDNFNTKNRAFPFRVI